MGRYWDPISRVLAAYPTGQGLVTALETLISTAEANARTKARDEIASTVCEGLHAGPPSGLKCRSCYEAEQLIPMEASVAAEIQMKQDDEPLIEATLIE